MQQKKNTLNYRIFPKPLQFSKSQSNQSISLLPRLAAFETDTTPDTFMTETRKNGSRDEC